MNAQSAFAEVRRSPFCDGWEAKCNCGWNSPPQTSEAMAEVQRDRHMATVHGITATRAEVVMKQQLAEARRELDVVQAQRDALKMGANPDSLATPPAMVLKVDKLSAQWEAEHKDLLSNMTDVARSLRDARDRISALEMTLRHYEQRRDIERPVTVAPSAPLAIDHPHGPMGMAGCDTCSERGPGIKSLDFSEEPLAWLDEDLLADDA